ncbi:MAG: glycosyltransferase [Caldilineaceae bacterium]|nr:glycosyltransferase [Caldilineaceae bacterium]
MLSVHTGPLAQLGGSKTGGMNVYVRELSRALGKRGLLVDVFTRAGSDEEPRIRTELGQNVRVIYVPAGPAHTASPDGLIPYLDDFATGVCHFAQEQAIRYDLLHSHYWLSGLVAEQLCQLWGPVPVVQMYHTLGHMKNQIAQDKSQGASQARIEGEERIIRFANRLIAATPAEENQLIQLYAADPAKITIIPPGVDLCHFRPQSRSEVRRQLGLPPDQKIALFVGRIEPLKGIDTILHATRLLCDKNPALAEQLTVAIVGGSPWAAQLDAEMARLQALRTQLKLERIVRFVGARQQSVLPDFYSAADVVLMPSHYESFGMVGLEAMACAAPLIAAQVGGLAYLVKDGVTGFLIPPRAPGELAERMNLLLSDELLRWQMGRAARKEARRYGWRIIADRVLDLYATTAAPFLAGISAAIESCEDYSVV